MTETLRGGSVLSEQGFTTNSGKPFLLRRLPHCDPAFGGRSNLHVFKLSIQIIPFRVHAFDENFFLFPSAALYSFPLSYCFDDGIKPLVENKLFAIIPRCETIGIRILFMLNESCSEAGSDTNIQCSVVYTARDVNISSYYIAAFLLVLVCFAQPPDSLNYEDTAGCPRNDGDSAVRY